MEYTVRGYQVISLVVLYICFLTSQILADDRDGRIYFPKDKTRYVGTKCRTSVGVSGICRSLSDCFGGEKEIQPSDLCSFNRNEPVYCCAIVDQVLNTNTRFGDDDDNNTKSSSNDKNEEKKNIRIIDEICNHYYPEDRSSSLRETNNNLSLMDMIQSHMVAVGWTNKSKGIDWKCTGTVVSRNLVLTDAQCVNLKRDAADAIKISTLTVPDRSNLRPENIFNVRAVYVHPDYNPTEIYHNIAILVTDMDIGNLKQIKPACLSSVRDIPESNLIRVGHLNKAVSQILTGNITNIPNEVCTRMIGKHLEISKGISSEQFCGQAKDNNCQNESGRSILHFPTGSSKPIIIGVTSTSDYCKKYNLLIYTRLSTYLDWIEPLILKYS